MRIVMMAVLAVLVVSRAGLAADACLAGASYLTDTRAVAAFRAAADAACPCTESTRSATYRSCARRVLRDAVDGGDLRPECRRTARAIVAGTVCGSTKVPCGRYTAGAADPLSCRPKAASHCVDRGRSQSEACTAETACVDVVDWTAATCLDVRHDGPFAPGAQVLTLTRTSTATYCTGGSGDCATAPLGADCRCNTATDCASGVCETHPRVLQTTVWYPASAGSGAIDPATRAVLDAPLDPSGGPYPLLMFSHGSCGFPNQSTFLTARLATYGFVVVAPPHPGNTLLEFPSCGTAAAQLTSFIERPHDVVFALDTMVAANDDVASPFHGAIDPARLGMSGHSFGGLTTYVAVGIEPRFKVALPMAAAVIGTPILTIPSMNMFGDIDSLVNLPAIRTAYANAHAPKFLVEIADAGHYAFSNGCFPSPDCAPPATLTQDEAHERVLRYALPFLEVYLAGDERFRPFLAAPAGPGYTVQAQF